MAGSATLSCEAFSELAPAVALDVGTPDEQRQVEQHAAECPDCAAELQALRDSAALLGASVPQVNPPPALRQRVMQAVDATPQLRAPIPVSRARSWRRRLPLAWLVAAASFMVSAGALVWVVMLNTQLGALEAEVQAARERAAKYEDVTEVLSSDRLAIRPLQPVGLNMPSRGMVYLDPNSGTGMIMCHNLPPIEQGHAYQVWFIRGNERVSGGLLWPDHYGNGYTLIRVPQDLQSFDAVGLTDEPGTGSAWPTTPRVIGGALKETSQ
jgi:hypothetical protein